MLRPGCQTPRETLTLNPNARTVLAVNKQVVEGVRFTGYVDIKANDVVLRNCLLPAAGYFAIRQYDNFGGLRLENVTVDGALGGSAGTAVFGGNGPLWVIDSEFLRLPADAVNLCQGAVHGCKVQTIGTADGSHADGVVVPRTTGFVSIVKNLLDGRTGNPVQTSTLPRGANHMVQVAPVSGAVEHGVEIVSNVIIGGGHSLAVYGVKYPLRNVRVAGNQIGAWRFGPLYDKERPADLVFERNVEWGTGMPIAL